MSQTKKQSIQEILSSTTIGMVGSWLITMGCLAVFTTPMAIATSTTLACTVWSIVRGYAVRRYFNMKLTQVKEKHTLVAHTHKGDAK